MGSDVMVGCGSHLLSGVELGVVLWRGDGGQIALAEVDSYHLRQGGWHGVGGHDGERDQQIEALLGPVIPEFGPADRCSLLEPGHMAAPALIGEDEAASEGQDTDLACRFEGVVASIHVGHGGRDVVGRLLQTLEALPGPAGFARFHVLVPFRPQGLIGGAHLPKHTARHLGGQAMRGAGLLVELVVQALAVGGFATRKGVQTRLIQRVTIGQLRAPQRGTLLGGGDQFELGRDGCLHRHPFFFTSEQTERRGGTSSHVLQHVGGSAARSHESQVEHEGA